MRKDLKLQELINKLVQAKREYEMLAFDEDESIVLGEPCSDEQIAKIESILGKALPPSYRAFLELHNGWDGFDGFGVNKLLSVEDHECDWVKKRVKSLRELFLEDDPFKAGAIPILLGKDEQTFMILDPRKVREDGEMDFVTFDLIQEEKRFKNFAEFLQNDLEVTQELIEDEKNGMSDEN